MFINLKRILTFLGVAMLGVFTVSCSEKEQDAYGKFSKMYYQKYPDGYDKDYDWYELKEESVEELAAQNQKVIRSSSFIGYIDFTKNSLEGQVTKYSYISEITTIKDGTIIKHSVLTSLLNDGNYYESIETTSNDQLLTTKVSKGCSDVDSFNIKVEMNEDPFYVDLYYDTLIYGYDSISVNDDHVTFDRSYEQGSSIYSEKTGYFFDEFYNITNVFLYLHKTYGYDEVRNLSTIKNLTRSKEIEINVPADYDEEFAYDHEFYKLYI